MAHNTPTSKQQPIRRSGIRLTDSLRLADMSNHASRLSHTNISAGRALTVILPMVPALILLAAAPRVGWGQFNTMVYDGTASPPGTCNPDDQCCQQWTITINEPTDSIILALDPAYGVDTDGCIDEDCWTVQGTATRLFNKEAPYQWKIVFGALDPAKTGPFPVVLNVELCATNACWANFPQWGWANVPGDYGGGPFDLTSCSGPPSCESGCSYVTATSVTCGTEVCFINQTGVDQEGFSLAFSPGLAPCQYGEGEPSTGGPECTISPNNNIYVMDDPNGCWMWTYDATYNILTVSPTTPVPPLCTGATIASCPNSGNSLCVFIPHCEDGEIHQSMTLASPYCEGSAGYVNINMKQADGQSQSMGASGSSEQNFPNPVDASTGFKTTIPFTTSASGTATIRIVDQTGKEIMKDNEEATYAGEHFFYFTATDIPAGTYYYQIEFPQGVVIQNKTMLIVK